MKYIITLIFSFVFLAEASLGGEKKSITDPEDRISYSLGYQIGGDLRRQNSDISQEVLTHGIKDAQAGGEPRPPSQEMDSLLKSLKTDIVQKQREDRKLEQKQIKEQYRGEGREFLARNGERKEVVTLASGLQYTVVREGAGMTPGPQDTVKVHYRGNLLDGTEFDSSHRRNMAAEFRVDGVIAGWTEALQLMKEGAKWRIFVPADLAYGERGPLADRTVIFDIELVEVVPSQERQAQ